MRHRAKRTLPPRPGFRHIAVDLAIGVLLAWLLPGGVNHALDLIDSSWQLGETGLSGVEVVALTTFILFVLQNVSWVNDVAVATTVNIDAQLEDWAQTALPKTLSSTLLTEMASDLLGGEHESSPGYVRGLELYTNVYSNLPREARLGAALLLSRQLQRWAENCEQLRTSGIGISQEEQVALIAEVCRSASKFLLIDPVLYRDIAVDWTKGWHDLVAGDLAASGMQLEYVYLSRVEDEGWEPEDRARLEALASYMTSHGWQFFTCDRRDISGASVSSGMYGRLFEVFDDTLMISMPQTDSFTTGKLTTTRLSLVDGDERRFVEAVSKYKKTFDSGLVG